MSTLLIDVIGSIERFNTYDQQPARRDLVRTVHAAIEGLVWVYREHIKSAALSVDAITQEEQAALSDVSYHVAENGKISSQQRYISTAAAIRLTTRIANRLDPEFLVNFGTEQWEKFRYAIEIRNRVTHPKRHADLEISDNDISTCLTAFFWFLEFATLAMEAANTAVANYTREFRDILDKLKRRDPAMIAEYEAIVRNASSRSV